MSRHLTNLSSQSEEIRNNLYSYSEMFFKRTDTVNISMHVETRSLFDAFHLLYNFFQFYNNKEFHSALTVRRYKLSRIWNFSAVIIKQNVETT